MKVNMISVSRGVMVCNLYTNLLYFGTLEAKYFVQYTARKFRINTLPSLISNHLPIRVRIKQVFIIDYL